MTGARTSWSVVVPTVGRATLPALLDRLTGDEEARPAEVVVVDDRPAALEPLDVGGVTSGAPVRVARSHGRGPAAARNLGWRLTSTPWVVFVDDDVVVPAGWAAAVEDDLATAGPRVGGVQGRLRVPLPQDRRPTDWERSTAGLEVARWATADMAYRREALEAVSGLDERFPRAYREDADLALRVRDAGWDLEVGRREVLHPVRPTGAATSLRVQRGNADDALMRRLHGRAWRERAETGRGRLRLHLVTVGAELLALASGAAALLARRPATRHRAGAAAAAAGLVAAASTLELARLRIAPGPRTRDEVVTMLWTSAAIPPAAVWHRLRGTWRHRSARPWRPDPKALLLDRDGTLVVDVPYNGDPAAVQPVEGAREALEAARAAGLVLGVVSNQSGVGRGLLTTGEVAAVNTRVDHLLGPFGTWQVCPHAPDAGCGCRKPAPGLVREAARALGVQPEECVVVGDIGADVEAAHAAGARAVLVPTPVTREEEVAAAPHVARDLAGAVDTVLGWRRG